jgi:transcriptional regulator with XRE-family HTH domain
VAEQAWRQLAEDFARELAELKKERGLSWAELGARSGVSIVYLRDLCSGRGGGRGVPSETVVRKIAAALDVEPDHFRLTRARAVLSSPKVIDTVYSRLRKSKAAA